MPDVIRQFVVVILRGLGQLAFVGTVPGGVLVLLAITLVSPWAAMGALAGASIATVVSYWLPVYTRFQWTLGLSGYNAAVIGIFWGHFFAAGHWQISLFVIALGLCLAVEFLLTRFLWRLDLPVLTLPAVVTAYCVAQIYAAMGGWFWGAGPLLPFGYGGFLLAVMVIVIAMATVSVLATVQAVILSGVTLLFALHIYPLDAMALIGLWGFTVASASFGIQAVFFSGISLGVLAGFNAAFLGGVIWMLWMSLGWDKMLPPLLLPFILGSLASIVISRNVGTPLVFLALEKKVVDLWREVLMGISGSAFAKWWYRSSKLFSLR